MRVAALAPLAAMVVALANAAPAPNADPFFCIFGWGPGCDSAPTTSSPKATSTSIAGVKTTSASTTVAATSVKLRSSSAPTATATKASSTLASATKAAAATSIANWTWLWDPTYIFNMWNNYNAFRWEKYNDCSFNGYSLTYVKAWYYQTYGFKPLNGCQWNDVHTFLAKYAVKTSVVPASTQKYTPGCANPFGGVDFNWKPTSSSASSKATSAVSASKAASSSALPSSAAATSKASSVVVSPSAASLTKAASTQAALQSAAAQVVSSQVVSSQAVSSQATSTQAVSTQAVSTQSASSVAQSSAVASQASAPSSVVASQVASSSVQSSVVASQPASSSVDSSSVAQATNSAIDGAGGSVGTGSASDIATSTDSAVAAPTSTAITGSGIKGTPITLSNGRVAQDLGCMAEVDGRKFTSASIDNPEVMTNEWCSNWCFNLGYPVSGTEYAKECYCSGVDKLASWTVSNQCVMPCAGDASGQSICGGPQALQVTYSPDAARTVSLPANWVEKGCFQDNSSRVLTYQAWSGKSDSTLESCSAQCASLGYTIAGAEYGSECFCGNEFVGGPVAIGSGRCNMPCAGNGGSQCGGSFALTVASLSS
ncbi:hypothetical protein QFC20_004776 [Naganishia adeliensis]|uniref:Uncharacterized protein n=1 Tax=Naganishia adeliensis TaxID=92952 RepID=A0ACC2VXG5_9TREE|nr:hypothetical protein QFC20_004776 [Naganishia adeliensis]